jgi:hypothetical protein
MDKELTVLRNEGEHEIKSKCMANANKCTKNPIVSFMEGKGVTA